MAQAGALWADPKQNKELLTAGSQRCRSTSENDGVKQEKLVSDHAVIRAVALTP
jgi:hypothetical protein